MARKTSVKKAKTQKANSNLAISEAPKSGTTVEHLQTFSLMAPGASSVQLVGNFTQWQEKPIKMERAPDGTWQASVALQPGVYHYRFLVDGQWQDDPACAMRVANPYGGQNSVREIA